MSAFGDAFKKARKKFEKSGSAGDYVFEHNGKKYSILKKGETKKGVMKKFSAPAKSLKPKLRPAKPAAPNVKDKTKTGPDGKPLEKKPITSRKLSPATVGKGRGDGNYETMRRTIDRSSSTTSKPKVTAKANPTTNSAKLDAWKAGDKGLSSKEQFRLAKWAERNDLSVPKDLAKDRVRLSLKTSKNKGGPVTKKPKGAYAAGGMPMVMKAGKKVPAFAADGVGKMNMGGMAAKKKKPAAKMMAGGMTKKSGYMYGGMAKKKMKK
jgi:hypothetical protein